VLGKQLASSSVELPGQEPSVAFQQSHINPPLS